jgi:hypothetical protein
MNFCLPRYGVGWLVQLVPSVVEAVAPLPPSAPTTTQSLAAKHEIPPTADTPDGGDAVLQVTPPVRLVR